MNTSPPRAIARIGPARFWAVAALLAVGLVLMHVAAPVLLLTFAGVLFATGLRGLAQVLAKRIGWNLRWVLALCIVGLFAVCAGMILWVAPRISEQFAQLADHVARAYESVRQQLQQSELGRRIVQQTGTMAPPLASLWRAAGFLGSLAGALASLVFVIVVTIYVAMTPDVYRTGLVRLVRPDHREHAEHVVDELATTLRRWLLGRLVSMTAVGIATALGLWALGIPLPLAMGVLAGLLGFIPNIGPIVSAVPAALLAATVGPAYVGYVVLLYLAVNVLDGYVLTPLIDRRSVSSPPALVITGQLLFGTLWGFLGVMLATPLIACAIIIVRRTYVERTLEAA